MMSNLVTSKKSKSQISVANTKVTDDVEPGNDQREHPDRSLLLTQRYYMTFSLATSKGGGYPISSLSPTQRYYMTLSLAASKGGTQSVLCRQHKGIT